MADDNNHILEKIESALTDPETPTWGRVVLLCIQADHKKLIDHLASHSRWSDPARQVLVSVATALAVALAIWLAGGRLPAVFGP